MSDKTINRRHLLRNAAVLGAGAALSGAGLAQTAAKPDIDVDVLNFALNLEYLEAELYLAAVGRRPSYATTGVGTAGAVTGG
jgi:hypothetical protein